MTKKIKTMFPKLEKPVVYTFPNPVSLHLLCVEPADTTCKDYIVTIRGFTLNTSKFTVESMTELIQNTAQKTTSMESEAATEDNLFLNHVLTQIEFAEYEYAEEDKYADNIHFVCDLDIQPRGSPVTVIVRSL